MGFALNLDRFIALVPILKLLIRMVEGMMVEGMEVSSSIPCPRLSLGLRVGAQVAPQRCPILRSAQGNLKRGLNACKPEL